MRQLLLLLVALAFGACSDAPATESRRDDESAGRAHAQRHRDDDEHDDDEDAEHRHFDAPAPGEITSGSIYNLAGQWWDADGDYAPLMRLAGRPQVVAMVYTSCSQACPAIVGEMKRIEAALGDDADHVGFVLASMDPDRDTPEKLAEFAHRAGLDDDRWTLLGSSSGNVLELAAVLGVQYRRLPDGEFTHSNMLTVLDANGEIAHRQLGLGEETARTIEAARGLIHTHPES